MNYTWGSLFIPAITTIPAASKVLLGFFALDTTFDETIVRVRGGMAISSDQGAANEDQIGAFGMIRATDRAVAAGAVSIPGPVTDGSDDGWFVYEPFAIHTPLSTAFESQWFPIDSKAQRVVREGQQVALMIENASALFGLRVTLSVRVLGRFRS